MLLGTAVFLAGVSASVCAMVLAVLPFALLSMLLHKVNYPGSAKASHSLCAALLTAPFV
jgi:hypothetical protein